MWALQDLILEESDSAGQENPGVCFERVPKDQAVQVGEEEVMGGLSHLSSCLSYLLLETISEHQRYQGKMTSAPSW